jgi:hypothetical protein
LTDHQVLPSLPLELRKSRQVPRMSLLSAPQRKSPPLLEVHTQLAVMHMSVLRMSQLTAPQRRLSPRTLAESIQLAPPCMLPLPEQSPARRL